MYNTYDNYIRMCSLRTPINPYIYIYIYTYMHLSIYVSIRVSIYLRVSIYPSIHLSIYPSIHPSIHPLAHTTTRCRYRNDTGRARLGRTAGPAALGRDWPAGPALGLVTPAGLASYVAGDPHPCSAELHQDAAVLRPGFVREPLWAGVGVRVPPLAAWPDTISVVARPGPAHRSQYEARRRNGVRQDSSKGACSRNRV